MQHPTRILAILTASAALATPVVLAQTARLDPVTSGAAEQTGRPRARTLQLSTTKPASITKAPASLRAPLYGIFPIGPRADAGEPSAQTFHVILDGPDSSVATLIVDANGNGDLTDDPPPQWEQKPYNGLAGEGLVGYEGGATLQLRHDAATFPARIAITRPDLKDASKPNARATLSYFADYARLGQLTLSTGSFKVLLADDLAAGDFRPVPVAPTASGAPKPSGIRLFIDLNGDEKFDPKAEIFDAAKPFTIERVRYEIASMSPLGDEFTVERSTGPAARTAGRLAKTFQATTLDRKSINFPSTYKGKLVLLDFWATWCGPCMNEVPGLVSAYKTYRPKGLEVLGISLDGAGARDHILGVTSEHDMTWQQVYDGKQWQARIAVLYEIRSIPAAFLVDGDTGEIVASGGALRGGRLAETIDKALARKAARSK